MLQLLDRRGYRRPGLIMEVGRDNRIQHRQTAAFRAFQIDHAEIKPVPLLISPGAPDIQGDFMPWFRAHRPDVVLSHFMDTLGWIEACTPRGRQPSGFVLLNVLKMRRRWRPLICNRGCWGRAQPNRWWGRFCTMNSACRSGHQGI